MVKTNLQTVVGKSDFDFNIAYSCSFIKVDPTLNLLINTVLPLNNIREIYTCTV